MYVSMLQSVALVKLNFYKTYYRAPLQTADFRDFDEKVNMHSFHPKQA